MRYLMVILFIMSTTRAFADGSCTLKANTCAIKIKSINKFKDDVNTPTPKQLKGATIIVQYADGHTEKIEPTKFKIVPRVQQLKVKEVVIVKTCDIAVPQIATQVKAIVIHNTHIVKIKDKNIISLTANREISGYELNQHGNTVRIDDRYIPAIGLMYQRNVVDSLYLGIQANTNRTFGGSIGVGF